MYSAHGRFDAGEGHLKPAARDQALIPRPRPGLLSRPTLIKRLNRGAESKFTLVSTPAGFGKTTLLAEWLATAEAGKQPAAWLAFDQSDNDPAVFWAYVIALLQTMQDDLGQARSRSCSRFSLFQWRRCWPSCSMRLAASRNASYWCSTTTT
jgi:ATP/maltotriose-dependent transcriptional regulator MalT